MGACLDRTKCTSISLGPGHLLSVHGLADCARRFLAVASVEDFERAVLGTHGREARSLPGLWAFLERDVGDPRRFWSRTLPAIVRWASRIEELFPAGVPYLTSEDPESAAGLPPGVEAGRRRDGWTKQASFSRAQAASLLCQAFLCAIPGRDRHDELLGFAPFSFLRLFAEEYEPFKGAKLLMLLQYFEQLDDPDFEDGGQVLILRRSVAAPPAWADAAAALSKLEVEWEGDMEQCAESLQVGMSNRYPGGAPGGVLATGKMQEPAFFASRPELLVTLLACPALQPNEALLVSGARQFGAFAGVGAEMRAVAGGAGARARAAALSQDLLVVDALDFRRADAPPQFGQEAVHRELLKLYAGFSAGARSRAVAATGNWCCDAFGGDKQLKLVLQLIACSAAEIGTLKLYPHSCEAGADRTDPSELPALELPRAVSTAGALYDSLLRFLGLPGEKRGRLFEHLGGQEAGGAPSVL